MAVRFVGIVVFMTSTTAVLCSVPSRCCRRRRSRRCRHHHHRRCCSTTVARFGSVSEQKLQEKKIKLIKLL